MQFATTVLLLSPVYTMINTIYSTIRQLAMGTPLDLLICCLCAFKKTVINVNQTSLSESNEQTVPYLRAIKKKDSRLNKMCYTKQEINLRYCSTVSCTPRLCNQWVRLTKTFMIMKLH